MEELPAAYYDELEELVIKYLHQQGDPEDHFLHGMWPNAPAEAASNLLCIDLLGEMLLTDEQVDHLWQLGYAEGYSPTDLVPDDLLAEARPERRTRPPKPVRFPLKGGGHGSGRGMPGKTEYPARWSDDQAMDFVMDVAQAPAAAVEQPDGTFRASGLRDGVELRVVVTRDGDVTTAYPVSGDGVVTNPLDEVRAPYVARLQRLVDATALDADTRAGIDELMQVGEWDQVLRQLRVMPTPDGQELGALVAAAGLRPLDRAPSSGGAADD